MKWPRLNLYRKVLLVLLAVGLVPAAVAVALTARELWQVTLEIAGDNLQTEARNLAGLLDREIKDFIARSEASLGKQRQVAMLLTKPGTADTTETLPEVLGELWDDDQSSHAAFLIPPKGQGPIRGFILPPGYEPAIPRKQEQYQFLEARRLSFRPGFKAVSIHTDPALDRPVALAWIPISRNQGRQFLGWIALEVATHKILNKQAWRALLDVDGVCVITYAGHLLGKKGVDESYLAPIQKGLAMSSGAAEGWFEAVVPDGSNHLVGFSPIPLTRALSTFDRADTEWYVCVQRDLLQFATEYRHQRARDLLAGILLAILLAAVAYLFARRLTRPIRDLQVGVGLVAAGDLSSRVRIKTGDELEELAQSFNNMAQRIQEQMTTVRRQADEIAVLHHVSRAINARLDLDQMLTAFAREVANLIAYDRFSVGLIDEDGGHFTIQFVFPLSEASEFAPGTRHPVSEAATAAAAAGKPVVRRGIDREPASALEEFLGASGLSVLMIVPLVSEGKTIGFVELATRGPGAFGPEEQERMANLAEPVAVAVQHSHLYMRIRRFAEELEGEVRRRTAQLRVAYDKLIQTEKLAATGQLAAGIAHEINNPLGIIKNYLRLTIDQLRRLVKDDRRAPLDQHLQVIDEEISRIARIVRNLLDLYHSPDFSPGPLDLHELIERVLELFTAPWTKRGIEVVRDFAPALPPMAISADRVRQILINLLRNAEDALEGAGRITITTRFEPAAGELDSDQVVIAIEDTGCGIPREALARVFDPFFTTKKGGQGTGLGLSVTYGIIRSYGGSIDLDSEPGRGTRVVVRLPLAAAPAQPAEPASTPAAVPGNGDE
jgi:signal transduction histidine kinase